MTKHLTENDVRDISAYTRIGVDEDELAGLTEELNSIIDELDPILQSDLTGVEPTFHPIGSLSNVVRDDEPSESKDGFTQEEALLNAPKTKDGNFLIPSILGEEGAA